MRKCPKWNIAPCSECLMWCLCGVPPHTTKHYKSLEEHDRKCSHAQKQGEENMLGIIAAVLIVLWLLGFFAFHITTSVIHIALIVGLILLVLHFMRGSTASA